MTATVVIPARFGSTRFPAKIVAADTGRPLVQHVVDQARKCKRVREIIVATDDQRIVDVLRPFETRCVMTSPLHPSGTDRIAEVAQQLSDSIIVNVQGDEPEIEPETIDRLIDELAASTDPMATVATPFPAGADPKNPNLVKVAIGASGRAVYFSRSPIPYHRDSTSAASETYHLHLGIYAYRREFLLKLAGLKPTPLELTEKLEQLRVLEHGFGIRVIVAPRATHGIDTPEQYEEFVRRYRATTHQALSDRT